MREKYIFRVITLDVDSLDFFRKWDWCAEVFKSCL
jgi:hypothetical protein